MDRPCHCNECHLCAVYAAAHGLPVRIPEKQPTLAEFLAATDATTGNKNQGKRKRPNPPADDVGGLFTGVD